MSDNEFTGALTDEVNMTDDAVTQMLAILENESEALGVRIFISGGGCSGLSYGMTLIQQPTEFDSQWEKNGLKVFIDSIALSYLEGVEIDYKTEGLNKSFVFKNVFQNTGGSGSCGGCGSAGQIMSDFKQVDVIKKANIYFDGKVTSRSINFSDGSHKSLGIMLPGDYLFNTDTAELMEIYSGKLEYKITGTDNWQNISAGQSFNVPASSSFDIKIIEVTDYCCSYL